MTCMTAGNRATGYVDVSVSIAGQVASVSAEDKMFGFGCPFGFHSLPSSSSSSSSSSAFSVAVGNANGNDRRGGKCVACPVGALCPGGFEPTVALPGYWMVSVTTMMPCLPESACLGNNTCAESYLGTFCSHCAASHFRLDLKCYACSENHATRLILSVLGYICGALLMFASPRTRCGSQA